jgi:hypothetical protein
VIVRWGLDGLDDLLVGEALLVASERWPDLGIATRWTEVPSQRIDAAAALARDCVVALGGGSAIDLGKAISARAEIPLVSIPTTYSGAEWTTYYGIREPSRRAAEPSAAAGARARTRSCTSRS